MGTATSSQRMTKKTVSGAMHANMVPTLSTIMAREYLYG
jgi:hypothetical protein